MICQNRKGMGISEEKDIKEKEYGYAKMGMEWEYGKKKI